MSCPQEPQKPSLFSFGNPLRLMRPKGSNTSSKLTALLNSFEQTLSARLTKLSPKDNESVLSLSWMASALHSVSESHHDIKSLLIGLELPIDLWEDKWITVYLDNTVKLLDVCTGFTSEISRLSQGNLLLKCLLHNLDHLDIQEKSFSKVRSSLGSWRRVIDLKNPRIENCCSILDKLVQSLNLPKIKNSAKGKVLMQAIYGVRVHTILVCSIIVAAFTGSMKKLTLVQVADTYPWAAAYAGILGSVDKEIRNSGEEANLAVVEVVALGESMKNLLSSTQGGSVSELQSRVAAFSDRLDVLGQEVDGLFRIVLNGRDALLGNLRASTGLSGTTTPQNHKKELMMR